MAQDLDERSKKARQLEYEQKAMRQFQESVSAFADNVAAQMRSMEAFLRSLREGPKKDDHNFAIVRKVARRKGISLTAPGLFSRALAKAVAKQQRGKSAAAPAGVEGHTYIEFALGQLLRAGVVQHLRLPYVDSMPEKKRRAALQKVAASFSADSVGSVRVRLVLPSSGAVLGAFLTSIDDAMTKARAKVVAFPLTPDPTLLGPLTPPPSSPLAAAASAAPSTYLGVAHLEVNTAEFVRVVVRALTAKKAV